MFCKKLETENFAIKDVTEICFYKNMKLQFDAKSFYDGKDKI